MAKTSFTTGELQLLDLWVSAAVEDAEDPREIRLGARALEEIRKALNVNSGTHGS